MTRKAKGAAVVAVGFDDQTEALMATAFSLARRFGVELRVVHVVAPLEGLGAFDYSASLYVSPLTATWDDEGAKTQAGEKMQQLLAEVPNDVKATGAVLSGPPTPCIAAEAIARRASVILTACNPDGYSALSQGFSTSIGLMHEAQLPVLTISRYAPLDFAKRGFHILLGDDLQEASHEAVLKAYELATRMGRETCLHHIHVHSLVRALIGNGVTLRPDATNATIEDQLDRENEVRTAKLKTRADTWLNRAKEAGVNITVDVRVGHVQTEIGAAASDFVPDLYVFGRHRLFRARPFLIGRMPFRTMLAERRAVLLVPPAQELYARLPFPAP